VRQPAPAIAPPFATEHVKPCENCVRGDYYACPCAWCGKTNRFITPKDMPIERHVPYGFYFTCPHCKKQAWYWATLQIEITSDKAYRKKK
jgi:hypothetical protein